MAKQPTKQQQPHERPRSVYHIKGTPAKFVRIVEAAGEHHRAGD